MTTYHQDDDITNTIPRLCMVIRVVPPQMCLVMMGNNKHMFESSMVGVSILAPQVSVS